MEITIPWTPAKAILNLAGKGDIRGWVNGVWIDRQGAHLVVWATTGQVLGAIQTEEPSTDGPDVFVPRHIIEACKGFAASATVKRENDGRMSISCMGTTHYWQDEGWKPVDWRRVVPSRCDGAAQQFDARLLGLLLKTRKALGHKDCDGAVSIAHSGGTSRQAGALVLLRNVPEFVGVLSPLLLDDKGSAFTATAPDWVRVCPRAAEQAADLI